MDPHPHPHPFNVHLGSAEVEHTHAHLRHPHAPPPMLSGSRLSTAEENAEPGSRQEPWDEQRGTAAAKATSPLLSSANAGEAAGSGGALEMHIGERTSEGAKPSTSLELDSVSLLGGKHGKTWSREGRWEWPSGPDFMALLQSKELGSWLALAAGPTAFLLVALLSPLQGKVSRMLGMLLWMAIWWLTEAVPIAVTSLLPLGLFPLLRIMGANEVAEEYFNDTNCLFLSSFILALAVERWNVHRRIALKMLLVFGSSSMNPRMLLLGFCACPGFVSMWISDTATAIMMVPMAVGILRRIEQGRDAPMLELKSNRISSTPPRSPGHFTPHHSLPPLKRKVSGPDDAGEKAGPQTREAGGLGGRGSRVASAADLEGPADRGGGRLGGGGGGVPGAGGGEEGMGDAEAVAQYSRGVVLGIAYSSVIGGISTLTGTGPNLILAGVWDRLYPDAPEITYLQWLSFAFPLAFIFLIALWGLLCWWYCPPAVAAHIGGRLDREALEGEYRELGPMSFAERFVLVDFAAMAFLWLTRSFGDGLGWGSLFGGLPRDGTVGILMATLLFIVPTLEEPGMKVMDWESCKRLPWHIILLMGGGFALSGGVKESGVSAWVAAQFEKVEGISNLLLVPIVASVVTFTTEFSSNSATATIFLPLLAEVAVTMDRHPLLLMIPATIACSFAFMLPIATPANAVAYSTGYLRNMREMMGPGMVLNIIGISLLTTFTPTLGRIVFNLGAPIESLTWLHHTEGQD